MQVWWRYKGGETAVLSAQTRIPTSNVWVTHIPAVEYQGWMFNVARLSKIGMPF